MTLPGSHISICGHAKHGKSTLAGRLAYEFNTISSKEIEAYEIEAVQRGKDFNKFSLIFLQKRPKTHSKTTGLPDDSSRSVIPSYSTIKTDGIKFTLIDTPGYSRFLSNIIYGIYISDKAIVVIESLSGVSSGTEAVCRILNAFNINVLCFCVSKMDLVGYSQKRFEEVREEIVENLIPKYKIAKDTPILPISALIGDGITSEHTYSNSEMSWFSEYDSLMDVIVKSKETFDQTAQDIRLAVEGPGEIFSPLGVGTVLVGTLESGELSPGQTLIAEPISTINKSDVKGKVRSIHLATGVSKAQPQPLDKATARAIVSVNIPEWSRSDADRYFRRGGVLGLETNKPRVGKLILCDIIFFESDTVYCGKEYILNPHVAETPARIRKIIGKDKLLYDLVQDEYDAESGELVRAEIELINPCCIETSMEHNRMSSFVIREMNRVVACGKCIQILE